MKNTDEKTRPEASCAPPSGSTVLESLWNHRAQMAPHQWDRQGGKLILASISEIERLRGIIREAWLETTQGDPLNVEFILREDARRLGDVYQSNTKISESEPERKP